MNGAVVSSKVAPYHTRPSNVAGANSSSSASDQSFDGVLSEVADGEGAAGKSRWRGSKNTQAAASTDSTTNTTDTTQVAINAPLTTTGTLPPELLAMLSGTGVQVGTKAATTDASVSAASLLAAASLAQDKASLSDDAAAKTASSLIAGLSIDHHLAPSTTSAKASVTKDVVIKSDADANTSATGEDGSSKADALVPTKDSVTPIDAKAKSAIDDPTLGEIKTDATSDAPHGSLQDSIQAIANAVSQLADAETTDQDSAAATASVATPATNVSLAPARTMTLQLTPADLGTVNVRMHLAGGGLDVQLSVSDQQTLGLLNRAHDSLSNAMNSDTYQLHSLVIQGTDAPGGASGGQNASQNNTGGDARSSQNQTAAGSGGRQDEGEPNQRQESRATQDSMVGASSSSVASSDQLFV